MRRITVAAIGLCVGLSGSRAGAVRGQSENLITAADFVYAGAFRLPAGPDEQHTSAYGGTALAYDAAHDSLFFVGHDWYQRVAEVSIPEIRKDVGTPSDLETARLIQPFTDVLEGHLNDIGSGKAKIGGLLPLDDRLVVSAYLYYDGPGSQTLSHFVTGLDFSHLPPVLGPYQVAPEGRHAGFVAGYMAAVPDAWRALLKAPYVTGQCCLAIVSRTSEGPALSVFDPAALGTPKAASHWGPVLGYPMDHPTLGAWDSSGKLFNGAVNVTGMVFPADSRSVLFFGRLGTGPFCYGSGTRDASRNGQPTGEGDRFCFDPSEASKGVHGYPYQHYVWAYDVRDLAAVRQGKKDPWDVKPYATWSFDLPFQTPPRQILGAAYDPAHRRVFVTAEYEDGDRPLVHVFTLRRPE